MNRGFTSFLFVFTMASMVSIGCSHKGSFNNKFDGSRDPAAGDSYRSSIGGIDLGVVYQPPTNVTPIICQKFEKDPQSYEDDLQAYKACQQGVGASRYMAERYSQGEGKYLGCVDGLQQGIHVGYLMSKDPSAEQLEEARTRYTNAKMETAIARATKQAKQDGKSVADDTIISRFRAVVGTNQQPDARYDYPSHSFGGYDDGYVADGRGGSFDDVYSLGWVSKGVRDFRAIEARAVYKLHRDTYAPPKLCQPVEVAFTENGMTLWDYFSARGQYNFEKYGWKNDGRTLDYFMNKVSGTPEVLFYNAIQGRTMPEKYKVEVTPARKEGIPGTEVIVIGPDGKPQIQRDAQGNIIYSQYKDIPAVYEERTRIVPVPGRDKAYYQGIFKKAFTEAYRDYYMVQYFGLGFVQAHRTITGMGELIGQLIGKSVASDYADFLAYNNKYQGDSLAAYNLEWKTNYDRQWARIWSLFADHSVVELNDLSLSGDLDDDIFQAGEQVRADVSLTNLGRKSENISFTMYGQLAAPGQAFNWPANKVPVSNIFNVPTPFLGQIDKSIGPREGAEVGIRVKGPIDLDTGVPMKKGKVLTINAVAEIDAIQSSVNDIAGSGNVALRILNPSKLESPSMITVRTILDHNMPSPAAQETVKMGPKENRVVNVQIAGLDPLEIINNGGISGRVMTVMSGRVLHERTFSAGISSRTASIAKYFNALALSPTGAPTGNDDRMGRIQELMTIIQQMTLEDIRRDVSWGNPSSTEGTVVGQLGRQFLSAKAAGTLTDEAKSMYNELGKNLDTLEIGVFSRKAYRKALNVFAPDVEVKKKNK